MFNKDENIIKTGEKDVRKSFKGLKIFEDDVKLIQKIKRIIKLEELTLESQIVKDKLNQFYGFTNILLIKFIELNNEFILIIGKLFPKNPKKNITFHITSEKKLLHFKEELIDFSKELQKHNQELTLASNQDQNESNPKVW